jgi:hypothetical protein
LSHERENSILSELFHDTVTIMPLRRPHITFFQLGD